MRQNLSSRFPTKRILPVARLHMVLSKKWITNALIRLHGCAGWSAPVLFATPRRQVFSRRGPYNVAPLKRVLHFQHLLDQYYHIRKHWLSVDSRSRLYLANHALIVRRDCSVGKNVKYFQSHCIHTQDYQWYFLTRWYLSELHTVQSYVGMVYLS